jgi:hypothetical protein
LTCNRNILARLIQNLMRYEREPLGFSAEGLRRATDRSDADATAGGRTAIYSVRPRLSGPDRPCSRYGVRQVTGGAVQVPLAITVKPNVVDAPAASEPLPLGRTVITLPVLSQLGEPFQTAETFCG